MANRYFRQFLLTKSPRTVILSGKISLSATGAVLSSTLDYASVTKTGVGTYTILMQDKYVETKSIQLEHEGTAPDRVKINLDTQAANKLILINTLVASVVADVTVACIIHVVLVFKDSTVKN